MNPHIQPRQPIAIMLSIAAGVILTAFSTLSLFTRNTINSISDSGILQSTTKAASETAEALAPAASVAQDALLGILLAAGVFLLLVGIGFFMKKKKNVYAGHHGIAGRIQSRLLSIILDDKA